MARSKRKGRTEQNNDPSMGERFLNVRLWAVGEALLKRGFIPNEPLPKYPETIVLKGEDYGQKPQAG
ncbi:hypothetical protein KKD19_04410 [Patescibacteria group bacterium]|nr:hypothetical protein [Patescibacteria group bacterium]MBU4512451.1 hypothetical protein [Patescibacteria group bacterium]MCG2692579.1 hypothetical protein [Candidatus Parcubacteria bacterium]